MIKDYSDNCNYDSDDTTNPCWCCCYFVFPIGCMHEDIAKVENGKYEKGVRGQMDGD